MFYIDKKKNRLLKNNKDYEFYEILIKLFINHPKHFNRMLMNKNGKYKDLLEWIFAKTKKLNDKNFNYNLTTRCHWIYNGLVNFPKCPVCKKEYGKNKNVKIVDGYYNHCSRICAENDINVKNKIEKTSFIKYGTRRPNQSKEVKDKIERTNIERYGYKCPLQNEKIKNDIRRKLFEKYGVEYNSQVPEIRKRMEKKFIRTIYKKYGVKKLSDIPGVYQKMKRSVRKTYLKHKDEILAKTRETWIRKYGTDKPQALMSTIKKREQTNIKRYGNATTFLAKDIKRKIENIFIKKYGTKSPLESKKFQKYVRKCVFEKYGVDHVWKVPEIRNKIKNTNKELYGCLYPHKKYRYLYNGITFDSSWELAFWIFNRDNNINIEKTNTFFKYNDGFQIRYYYPDFKIGNRFYEVKGDQFFDKNGNMINPFDKSKNYIYRAKQLCMKQNNVKLVTHEEIIICFDYISETYGKGYVKKFRKTLDK